MNATASVGDVSSRTSQTVQLFLQSPEFHQTTSFDQRYLGLLSRIARSYAFDFADFISHQESARHYLRLNRDSVNTTRAHNRAQPIAGTQYWAVMAISNGMKERFMRRLLEYIGCHDDTIAHAIRALRQPTTSA